MNNIHTSTTTHKLKKGTHTLHFYGLDAGLVLQKLVLTKNPLPYSYFGPQESFYKGRTDLVENINSDLEPDLNYTEFDLFPGGNMEPRWPKWGEGPFIENNGQVGIEAEIALENSENAKGIEGSGHNWTKVVGQFYGAMNASPNNGGQW